MEKSLKGRIDINDDDWAMVDDEKFADWMCDVADESNNGLSYKTYNMFSSSLNGKKAIIKDVNIVMYFSNDEIDFEKAQEMFLTNMFTGEGIYEMEANYIGYSEFTITGYVLDECCLGEHNLNDILNSHKGEYVNIRVEC